MRRFVRLQFTLVVAGVMLASMAYARQAEASNSSSNKLSIRSGLTGNVGLSHLHIDDDLLPLYATSDYYTFKYDFFVNAGAMIVIDPGFKQNIEFVFDPSFSKYSYGSLSAIKTDTILSIIDIDMEAIKFPLSVRYSWQNSTRLSPFIRVGGSFSYFVDTEAYFKSKIITDDKHIESEYTDFAYSGFQNTIFGSIGIELNIKLADLLVEFVVEKGDGLHKKKYGDDFLKASNTTSLSLQFSVLF